MCRSSLWVVVFVAAVVTQFHVQQVSAITLPVCQVNDDCGTEAFCAPRTVIANETLLQHGDRRRCLPCWLCCSLSESDLLTSNPDAVGCPTHCDCRERAACSGEAECSDGMVCNLEGSAGQCQGCHTCAPGQPGCSSTCRLLGGLVDYLGKSAEAGTTPMQLLPTSPDAQFMQEWVKNYTGTASSATWVVESARKNPNAEVSPWTVLTSVSSFHDTCFVDGSSEELRRVVYPGCPCNPDSTAEEGRGICPAGYHCSHGLFSLNSGLHTCLPCPRGTFCPAGTRELQDVTQHLCPEGHFCSTPARKEACPPGEFCPLGSTYSSSCSYLTLFAEDRSTVKILTESNVLSELIHKRRPWGGNLCLDRATDPFQGCPKAHYCPAPDEINTCPAGSKCLESSTEPTECDSLVLSCPEGSSHGSISIMGIVIVAGLGLYLILMVIVVKFAYKCLQRRQSKTVANTDSYMKVKRIILETRSSLHPSYLSKLLKSPMQTCERFLRANGSVDLEFEDLGLQLRNGSVVLQGVSGRFDAKKLIAVMGPSGAGKSTFLNVLCGKAKSYGKVTGTLRVNGEETRSVNVSPGKRAVGFVPQDDIVHEDLTVRENLWFSAMARLPSSLTLREKGRIIEEVLFSLKLDHIEHSIVGSVEKRGISGGQRKRVNIGLELSALPTLLFLDEPTSGLDSTASTDVLDTLKHCAHLGMTVMTVIHQPRYSIFTGCDDVLFLGKGGRTAYLGPTKFAATYFDQLGFHPPPNDNPADFCIDVLSGSVPREGDLNFKPADLFDMWTNDGPAQVDAFFAEYSEQHSGLADTTPTPYQPYTRRTTEIMPRDVECMGNIFRDIDIDGDGLVSPSEVLDYFKKLGLEMNADEVQAFCAGKETISKNDFLSLMRNGPVDDPPAGLKHGQARLRRAVGKTVGPLLKLASTARSERTFRSPHSASKPSKIVSGISCFSADSTTAVVGEDFETPTAVQGMKGSLPSPSSTLSPKIPVEVTDVVIDTDAEAQQQPSTPVSSDKAPATGSTASTPSSHQLADSPQALSRLSRVTHSTGSVTVAVPTPQIIVPPQSPVREGDEGQDDHAGADDLTPEMSPGTGSCLGSELNSEIDGDDGLEPASRTVRFQTPGDASSTTERFTSLSIETSPEADHDDDDDNAIACPLEEGGMPDNHFQAKEPGLKCSRDVKRAGFHFGLVSYRRGVQWIRAWPSKVTALLTLSIAGAILGIVLRYRIHMDVVPLRALLAQLTLALLSSIPSLQVFSAARPMWWRERSSGFSPTGTGLACMCMDTFDVFIRPVIFLAMFYYFILPAISFWDAYVVFLATSWYGSGLAYMFAALMEPATASITLVCTLMVIGGLFSGVLPPLASLRGRPVWHLFDISYTRWGIEALTIQNYAGLPDYQQPPAVITLYGLGYCDMDIKLGNLGEQVAAGLRLVLDGPEIRQQVELLVDAVKSSVGGDTFITRQCTPFVQTALLVIFGWGLAFRVVALVAFRYSGRKS